MFVLRPHHLRAFEAAVLEEYRRRAVDEIRTRLPRRCAGLGDDALRELVRAGVEKALGYGIDDDAAVTDFLLLVVAHGLDFDAQDRFAWARALLASPDFDGAVRVALVYDRLPAHLRPEPEPAP